MKLVILERYALKDGDLDWSEIRELADEVETYPRTAPDEVIPRLRGAQFAVANKVNINEAVLRACPDLQWVGMTSTGTDSLDLEACRRHGVLVANVPGYSTPSVAQCAFALLLELCHHVADHSRSVKAGDWSRCPDFCYWNYPLIELGGKTFGVIGYGRIGRAAAKLAKAFGMNVVAYDTFAKDDDDARIVSLDELLAVSDVISLHCPLFPETKGIIGRDAIAKMKDGVFLINTSRGPLVDEDALAEALHAGKVAGAGLDVLCVEPAREDNPLLREPNCLITPHIAWAPKESRQRLMDIAVDNLCVWQAGAPQNVVNP